MTSLNVQLVGGLSTTVVFIKVTHVFVACLKFPRNRKAIQHFSSGDGSPRGNKDRWVLMAGLGRLILLPCRGLLKWLILCLICLLIVGWFFFKQSANNSRTKPAFCNISRWRFAIHFLLMLIKVQNWDSASIDGIVQCYFRLWDLWDCI